MEIRVQVKAGARRESLEEGKDGSFRVAVKEPAEQGAANARVRELVALRFGVPAKSVRIVAGQRSPHKRLRMG